MGLQELRDIRARADRVEATTVPGARVLTPKEQMLDATDVAAKHPDLHLRWVNIRDKNKAETRTREGYRRLSSDEGGRHLGDEMALFGLPREVADRKRAELERLNEERLVAHEREYEATVEGVARALRDRYGVKFNVDRILIKE